MVEGSARHSHLGRSNASAFKRYRTKLQEGREPATVVRYMAALSHAFTMAVNEWQWLDDNPCVKSAAPKSRGAECAFG